MQYFPAQQSCVTLVQDLRIALEANQRVFPTPEKTFDPSHHWPFCLILIIDEHLKWNKVGHWLEHWLA